MPRGRGGWDEPSDRRSRYGGPSDDYDRERDRYRRDDREGDRDRNRRYRSRSRDNRRDRDGRPRSRDRERGGRRNDRDRGDERWPRRDDGGGKDRDREREQNRSADNDYSAAADAVPPARRRRDDEGLADRPPRRRDEDGFSASRDKNHPRRRSASPGGGEYEEFPTRSSRGVGDRAGGRRDNTMSIRMGRHDSPYTNDERADDTEKRDAPVDEERGRSRGRGGSMDARDHGGNGDRDGTVRMEEDTEGEDAGEVDDDDGMAAMQAMMGFGGFGSTKGQKIAGNNAGAVRKEKKVEYRQYMNRQGGFNRPLSPSR